MWIKSGYLSDMYSDSYSDSHSAIRPVGCSSMQSWSLPSGNSTGWYWNVLNIYPKYSWGTRRKKMIEKHFFKESYTPSIVWYWKKGVPQVFCLPEGQSSDQQVNHGYTNHQKAGRMACSHGGKIHSEPSGKNDDYLDFHWPSTWDSAETRSLDHHMMSGRAEYLCFGPNLRLWNIVHTNKVGCM